MTPTETPEDLKEWRRIMAQRQRAALGTSIGDWITAACVAAALIGGAYFVLRSLL